MTKAIDIGVAAHMAALAVYNQNDLSAAEVPVLPEGIPDRLCIEGHSRFNSAATPYIGVRIDGEESRDVVEYCVSQRWVRLAVRNPDGSIKRVPGRVHDLETTRRNNVTVEPFWRSQPSRQVRRALARGK